MNFHTSIGKELLMNAIMWMQSYTPINNQCIDLILQSIKMFLYFEDEWWVKNNNKDFNVSQGSYDSAEIYELDGQFLLSEMEKFIPKKQLRRRTFHGWPPLPLSIERLRKQIVKVFNAEHCLKITVELNKRSTDFLDVIFDLVHISLTEKISAPPSSS